MRSVKWLALLGFCAKARGMQSGAQACESLIKSGKCALLILSADLSEKALQDYQRMCDAASAPLRVTKEDIGAATGRPQCMAIAVTDPQWAERIYKQMELDAPIIAGVE